MLKKDWICFSMVMVILLVVFVWSASNERKTEVSVADYYNRLRHVTVAAEEAEQLKEKIRPVVADVIPEGYLPVSDMVATYWRSIDCYFDYWVLLEGAYGEKSVMTFDFPETNDSVTFYRFLQGEIQINDLPEVRLGVGINGKYHLYLAEEDLN